MEIINYDNLRYCTYFEPIYRRPGIYFNLNYEGINFVANYEKIKDKKVYIIRAAKKIIPSHWIHLYFVYKYCKINNIQIDQYVLVSGNKKHYINENEIMNKEKWINRDIKKLKIPKKETGSHCRFCSIKLSCHKELFENGDITVIPGANISTIKKFNELNIEPFNVIETNQIEKITGKLQKILYNLKAYKYNKIIEIEKTKLPKEYIIFDVESYMNLDFLYGFLIDNNYKYFLFKNNIKSKIEDMIDWLYNQNKILIHYDINDIKALNSIGIRYPHLKNKINKISNNSLDLYKIITKNYAFPITSYSLKDISKYFDFLWRTDLNGYAVLIEYQRHLLGDKNAMQKILSYNEDDCRATKHIMDKLEKMGEYNE